MFKEGQSVELIPIFKTKKQERFIVKISRGEKFSCKYGNINLEELIGKDPGVVVETHLGYKFVALEPTLSTKIRSRRIFNYKTQIIYPRDWGLIIAFSNIRSGSKIIEIGTGSGAFTAFLSEIVGEKGYIWSYDVDIDRLKTARKNLEMMVSLKNYTLKLYTEVEGITERNVDTVFIDIPEPWLHIKNAWRSLKPGGFLVIYVPTFNQVKKTLETLIKNAFVDIKVIEGFTREIQYKPYAIRPEMKGYLFSAFIIFSRKSFVIPKKLYDELTKMEYV